jgi:hypothetical protein
MLAHEALDPVAITFPHPQRCGVTAFFTRLADPVRGPLQANQTLGYLLVRLITGPLASDPAHRRVRHFTTCLIYGV